MNYLWTFSGKCFQRLACRGMLLLLILALPLGAQQLRPGDGVRITFYNIPDKISGDYFITRDGKVPLPFIGAVATEGKDFGDIRREIFNAYDSLYRNPELTIQPLYKIKILGEVRNPGVYYATGVEKLSDLLAQAGGQTDDANLKKIYLIQNGVKKNINAKEMLEKGNLISDYGLRSGSQIYVPKKWLNIRKTSVILSGVAVTATLLGILLK